MAQGDVEVFDQFLVDVGLEIHQLETDVIKVALVDGVTTPATTTADPRWGAGGTTNFLTRQVTPGGNYATGGETLANNTYTLVGGLAQFDADDPPAWLKHASNPIDATWGIIYNDTTAGKQAIGYVDIGGVFDMTTGDLTLTVNANGIYRLNQA